MSEMTPEKNDKINAFADGLAGMVKENRRFLVREAIEAAEERGRQSVQSPSEWADLSHLTGRELVERLKARAMCWEAIWLGVRDSTITKGFPDLVADMNIIIDLIYAKEQTVTREAERLEEEPEEATE